MSYFRPDYYYVTTVLALLTFLVCALNVYLIYRYVREGIKIGFLQSLLLWILHTVVYYGAVIVRRLILDYPTFSPLMITWSYTLRLHGQLTVMLLFYYFYLKRKTTLGITESLEELNGLIEEAFEKVAHESDTGPTKVPGRTSNTSPLL